MPVRRPSPSSIPKLIDALWSADVGERESAAARLTLLGSRAVPGLRALVSDQTVPPHARITALRTLAGIVGGRVAAEAAAEALADPDDTLAAEAIATLHTILQSGMDDAVASQALEHLTALALAPSASVQRRLAALDALACLPAGLLRPVLEVLADDSQPEIAARGRDRPSGAADDPGADDSWPDTPEAMIHLLRTTSDTVSITRLGRALDVVRMQQQCSASDAHRRADAWLPVRGVIHHALARRGSRMALYDLRETLADTGVSLPVDFFAAAGLIADANCLDPVASRWEAAEGDPWLREQLAHVFRAIVDRHALHRAHPRLARLLTQHPASGPLVALAPRTKPPSRRRAAH